MHQQLIVFEQLLPRLRASSLAKWFPKWWWTCEDSTGGEAKGTRNEDVGGIKALRIEQKMLGVHKAGWSLRMGFAFGPCNIGISVFEWEGFLVEFRSPCCFESYGVTFHIVAKVLRALKWCEVC
jgi:hypothetical protein